jgi:transposase
MGSANVSSTRPKKEVHGYCDPGNRSRQERVCVAWCGCHRPRGVAAPQRTRAKLLELIASLPPCLIGMEACSGAHHWARLFAAHGHTVRLMAPKFVVPYGLSGKRGKNDAADAAAICEAVARPSMRFVPDKNLQQQSELLVHRARQVFVQQRTATLNRIRGLLSEFGVVLPLKAATVRREAMRQLEDLPGWANTVIGDRAVRPSHRGDRQSQRTTAATDAPRSAIAHGAARPTSSIE